MDKNMIISSRTLRAASLAAVFAAATVSTGHAQGVASTSPTAVKAGTYHVEPGHTQVEFSLSHFGFTNYTGLFSNASGTLVLDPAHPAASKLTVTIPVDSVQTTVPKLTDELKAKDWFDAAQYPNATFESTSVTLNGKSSATVIGNLTLHGVTRPVTLKAHLMGSGVNPIDKAFTVGFEVTGTIRRGDFGIKQYLPVVGDDVHLRIAGAFERQDAGTP